MRGIKRHPSFLKKSLSFNAFKAFEELHCLHTLLFPHTYKTCTLPPPEDLPQSLSLTSMTMRPLSGHQPHPLLPHLSPFPLLTHAWWPPPGSPPSIICHAPCLQSTTECPKTRTSKAIWAPPPNMLLLWQHNGSTSDSHGLEPSN